MRRQTLKTLCQELLPILKHSNTVGQIVSLGSQQPNDWLVVSPYYAPFWQAHHRLFAVNIPPNPRQCVELLATIIILDVYYHLSFGTDLFVLLEADSWIVVSAIMSNKFACTLSDYHAWYQNNLARHPALFFKAQWRHKTRLVIKGVQYSLTLPLAFVASAAVFANALDSGSGETASAIAWLLRFIQLCTQSIRLENSMANLVLGNMLNRLPPHLAAPFELTASLDALIQYTHKAPLNDLINTMQHLTRSAGLRKFYRQVRQAHRSIQQQPAQSPKPAKWYHRPVIKESLTGARYLLKGFLLFSAGLLAASQIGSIQHAMRDAAPKHLRHWFTRQSAEFKENIEATSAFTLFCLYTNWASQGLQYQIDIARKINHHISQQSSIRKKLAILLDWKLLLSTATGFISFTATFFAVQNGIRRMNWSLDGDLAAALLKPLHATRDAAPWLTISIAFAINPTVIYSLCEELVNYYEMGGFFRLPQIKRRQHGTIHCTPEAFYRNAIIRMLKLSKSYIGYDQRKDENAAGMVDKPIPQQLSDWQTIACTAQRYNPLPLWRTPQHTAQSSHGENNMMGRNTRPFEQMSILLFPINAGASYMPLTSSDKAF